MLMEDRAEKSHGTENGEKSMSLGMQKVYDQKPWVSAVKKRGSRGSGNNALKRKLDNDEQTESRKKSKKEVFLSSLSNEKKSKKGVNEVCKSPLNSNKPEAKEEKRVDGGSAGLGGIALSLNGNITIPKRPRDLVRRKKVEVDLVSKQEGTLSSKASSAEGGGKLNGNADGTLLQNGGNNGKLAWNNEYEGNSNGSLIEKVKRRKNSHNHKENSSSCPDLLQRLKSKDSCSSLRNGNSLTKKARRNHKKNKETRTKSTVLKVEANPSLDESSRICDDSLDDEENLEANAARMLSSRFDPSCTGFSTGGNISKIQSANGFSDLISSSKELDTAHLNSRVESDIAYSDAEARVLRPRDQEEGKGLSEERPHFYVLSRGFDSYWVVNRRIKVFWPLDKRWYLGHVIGYDLEKKLHHVEYDDCEEEWIDLHNERFKLLLLPSELPKKAGCKRSTEHSRKTEHGEIADAEKTNSSFTESEPIISWLARSTHRKSATSGTRKKKRTLLGSAKSQSSSISEGKIEPHGSLEMGCSVRDAADFACSSSLPNNSGDSLRKKNLIPENLLSNNDRSPIVYYRKRFHKKEQPSSAFLEGELYKISEKPRVCGNAPEFVDSIDLGTDISLLASECGQFAKRLSKDKLIWDTDGSGLLKLIIPVTSLKVFKVDLSFPLPVVTRSLIGLQSYMFLDQHGSLVSTWPLIHLEMLFVDNVVGLRFLMFECCMKQAVPFVFLVLAVFCQSEQKEVHHDQQLPMTSVRLRFTGLQYLGKQLVFTFYNFSAIADSKWSYLDRKLKKNCMLTKQLPPSDCTFDNIKALRNGCNQLKLTDVSRLPSVVMNVRKRPQRCGTNISSRPSSCVKLNQLAYSSASKLGRLPSFALSFSAAPTFFLSLHLRLLMERSIPSSSFREQDPVYLLDHPDTEVGLLADDGFVVEDNPVSSLSVGGNLVALPNGRSELARNFQDSLGNEEETVLQRENGKAQSAEIDDNHLDKAENKVKGGPLNGMAIDIPSCVSMERDNDADLPTMQNSIDLTLGINDGVCSPKPTVSESMWGRNKGGNPCSSASVNLSPGWTERKQDFLRSSFGRSKKPRTQVSYSLPLGGQDYCSKSKLNHSKGFSHKRIRRASEKKTPEAFGTCQRNMELLSCEANLLVIVGDRGWRECGAKIVLELFDHNEWKLAVKVLGDTRFSYKAHQFVQPGTTNRYTHVMMWKGGKDWILEFPDRSQWMIFKEMHEECYIRNFRAASVKNIPIPGVRLVEENDENVPEVPFVRPSSIYYRQVETDVDIAINRSRVLYDMDSDDERWMKKHRSLVFNDRGCGDVSDEMFEKTVDVLEKIAYAKQHDHFSLDELAEAMAEVGPFDAIKMIYEYWRDKRQMKGMPLVRHLQPPLWEKYQQQVKEWEQAMAKTNLSLSNGSQEKLLTTEKPQMFAFCLKPRGLELPHRGSKQRSQKKLPVGALSNGIGDTEAFHSLLVGRRLNGFSVGDDRVIYTAYNQGTSDSSPVLQGSTRVFSPRDSGTMGYFSLSSDGCERNHYQKLHRNKSKKLCFIPSSSDQQSFTSYSQRALGNRSSAHLWNSSEWASQMHYPSDGFPRHNFEQLDPSELDEFRLRDAASAARHAISVGKMKRENAQRMLCRADLAMHKAVAAIMTSEAVKASYREPNSDDEMSG